MKAVPRMDFDILHYLLALDILGARVESREMADDLGYSYGPFLARLMELAS